MTHGLPVELATTPINPAEPSVVSHTPPLATALVHDAAVVVIVVPVNGPPLAAVVSAPPAALVHAAMLIVLHEPVQVAIGEEALIVPELVTAPPLAPVVSM
jgi:hypothetical protein